MVVVSGDASAFTASLRAKRSNPGRHAGKWIAASLRSSQ
jgi:hypothetical protein